LNLQDLLSLRNGSKISTTAGTAQAPGDGGNIDIETDFIVADPNENSDISANAFTGRGGQANISAEAIFGIQERDFPTPLSDITASSEFGVAGVVEIETPEVDPNRALAALPETSDEVELAQGCQAGDEQGTVAFFNLGRGGLPPTPEDPLSSETIITPWIELTSEVENDLDQATDGVPKLSNGGTEMLFPICRQS
jgi:large exoprotein involved in heme utilization and adhesion